MSEPPPRPPGDWEQEPTQRLPPSEEPTRPLPTTPEPPPPPPPPPPPRSGWQRAAPWLVGLLVLAVLGGGLAYLLLRDDGGTETKSVPAVVRLPEEQAVQTLEDAGFSARVVRTASDAAQEGVVFAQNPVAGVQLEEGAAVSVSVSSGPATAPVPSVVGLPQEAAEERLADSNLRASAFEVFSQEPEGVVVAQNPQAGQSVPIDSAVRINVSKGTGLVDVPELVGQDVVDATAALEQAGLEVNPVEVPSQEVEGTVVAQNPQGGQKAQRGSTVRINVSLGPS